MELNPFPYPQVRQLGLQIKAEEDFLREQQRADTRARAVAAEESRKHFHENKNHGKEVTLAKRQQVRQGSVRG